MQSITPIKVTKYICTCEDHLKLKADQTTQNGKIGANATYVINRNHIDGATLGMGNLLTWTAGACSDGDFFFLRASSLRSACA